MYNIPIPVHLLISVAQVSAVICCVGPRIKAQHQHVYVSVPLERQAV